jgi:hypothetical protein
MKEMKKMKTEKILGIWMQPSGVEIIEAEYDHDAHAYEMAYDGRHVVTIYTDTLKDTEVIRACLNAGEDVRDWEDGNGRCIGTLITERTGDGLRETLKRLERDGECYCNNRLGDGADGTLWVDQANGVWYEYETDDMVGVDDLTDDELLEVRIGGL